MADENTIRRVLKVINESEKPLTIYNINQEIKSLPHASVKSAVYFLEELGFLEVITNGHTILIRRLNNDTN